MSTANVLGIARESISTAKNGSVDDLPSAEAMDKNLRRAVGETLSAGEAMAVRHFYHAIDRLVDQTDASPKAKRLHDYQDTLRDILSNTDFSISGQAAEYVRVKVFGQAPRWF